MLDDCKGDRLEEILATFSNAVLKKIIDTTTSPIAQQLAFENFSYSGERTTLSTLVLAHKASLHSYLRVKSDADARYHDFADLLNLNERRITRRREQLKQITQDRGLEDELSTRDVRALQDQVTDHWSGREEWLETILYGDSNVRGEDLLAVDFDSVWRHVEDGRIGDIEEKQHIGLLEQLDARVRSQEARLARWHDFGKTLSKTRAASPTKTKDPTMLREEKFDLGFNLHQSLHINHSKPSETVEATSHKSLTEYMQLIENMKIKLEDVGKPPTREQLTSGNLFPEGVTSITTSAIAKDESPPANDEWSSVSDIDETQPDANSYAEESSVAPEIDPIRGYSLAGSNSNITLTEDQSTEVPGPNKDPRGAVQKSQGAGPTSPKYPRPQTPPSTAVQEPDQAVDSEPDLADQIVNRVSISSPSPTKARHTLSLAERTRLSMSRASHSQYSDVHDHIDNLADLPRLPSVARSQPKERRPSEEKHADLIERTRQSMAGFEAAQKKAQLERRKSVKDAKKRQRESSYIHTLDEEPSRVGIDPLELIEGEPDYESIFKSRPKIMMSPPLSPTRTGDED